MKHSSRTTTSIAVAFLVGASCTHQIVRVHELPSPHPVENDPALSGKETTLLAGPPAPPQFEEKGAIFEKIQWLPTAEFVLKPGETHVLNFVTKRGAILFVRASWSGGAGPVTVLVMKDGSVLASGTSYTQTPDRGIALARGDSMTSGNATLSILNAGPRVVKVRADLGMLIGG